MSRRIIEVYVAAICFAATLSILLSAPHFFRARHAAFYAEGELPGLAGRYASDSDRFDKELARLREDHEDYEVQRETLLLTGAVMAGHLVLLVIAEAIFRRRSRSHPIAATE